MNSAYDLMALSPVIPVLTIEDASWAHDIAEALVAGGLRALEVTLRTPAGLEAIRQMSHVEGAVVGAGTVLSPWDLEASLEAGARFIVSPGLTEPLAKAATGANVPFLPGVATASDIMRGLDLGLKHFKFFPAEAAGGRKALASLAAPFHQVRFCPTGGVTLASAVDWLAMPSVLCVGGSWLVPAGPSDREAIRQSAAEAAALARAA
jgi:2-dehydro-3-deoxyphosphogluconate aldolase/(4S)-4-hydroxy-2-oxoglutarate aldolase